MLLGERRARERHGKRQPGLVRKNKVKLPFHKQYAVEFADMWARAVEPVEHSGLFKQNCFRRVNILCGFILALGAGHLFKKTAGHGDRFARQAKNRKDYTPAEAVKDFAGF